MLVGRHEFIEQARLARKALGGGMRQAGVLAAAGLVAIESSPAGMPADHANARLIGESLAEIPGISINPAHVETNIVRYEIARTGLSSEEFSARLKERGVLANGAYGQMRMVTHFDVSRKECEQAMEAVREAVLAAAVSASN
jgi:threonine aldolase